MRVAFVNKQKRKKNKKVKENQRQLKEDCDRTRSNPCKLTQLNATHTTVEKSQK